MYILKLKTKKTLTDAVCLDVPLFLYLLEHSKEKTDEQLHVWAEKIVTLSKEEGYLTMDHLTKL